MIAKKFFRLNYNDKRRYIIDQTNFFDACMRIHKNDDIIRFDLEDMYVNYVMGNIKKEQYIAAVVEKGPACYQFRRLLQFYPEREIAYLQ